MDLREVEIKRIERVSELFLKAARAVPADRQTWKPAPEGKSVQEIVAHVGMANYFFATLICGAEKSMRDVTDYQSALQLFEDSKRELQQTIRSLEAAAFEEKRTMPWGEVRSVKDLITSPMPHIAYHWGQINYLQMLWGDNQDRF